MNINLFIKKIYIYIYFKFMCTGSTKFFPRILCHGMPHVKREWSQKEIKAIDLAVRFIIIFLC